MNIKSSKKLNELMYELYNKYDFSYINSILIKADFYTISMKTSLEDTFAAGVRLGAKAKKLNKPLWEVYTGDYSAYFVRDLSEIKKIFQDTIEAADAEIEF